MHCGNGSAGPAGDVDAVQNHRQTQLLHHARRVTFQFVKGQRARIEVGCGIAWRERAAIGVGEQVEGRELAVGRPRHLFLRQHFIEFCAQPIAVVVGAFAGIG